MFVTKLYHTAGHAGINAFGDIGLCIPLWNASRVDELGTYQVKHGMMPQTHYAFPTEPNRTMKVGVLFLRFAFIPPLKSVGFSRSRLIISQGGEARCIYMPVLPISIANKAAKISRPANK